MERETMRAIEQASDDELSQLFDDPRIAQALERHKDQRQKQMLDRLEQWQRAQAMISMSPEQAEAVNRALSESLVQAAAERYGKEATDKLSGKSYEDQSLWQGMANYLLDVSQEAEAIKRGQHYQTEEAMAEALASGQITPADAQQWYRTHQISRRPGRRI